MSPEIGLRMRDRDHHYDAIVVGGRAAGSTAAAILGELGQGVLLAERGRHAVMAAEAIAAWLSGRATEEEALANYRAERDEHVLADWSECTSLARDLSRLAAA